MEKKNSVSLCFHFFLFLGCLLFTYTFKINFFVFDNIVQTSVSANFYYYHHFQTFFLPNEIATGHPTFVGYYIAVIWKLFGRSLLNTHLAFMPFIYGFCFYLFDIVSQLKIKKADTYLIFFLTLLDATLISQLSILTFDIVELFFFVACISNILKNKPILLTLFFIGLGLTSMRGTMCALGIVLYQLINSFQQKKIHFKTYVPYLPGILSFIVFFILFYLNKHWLIHNLTVNNWPNSSQFASPIRVIRNFASFFYQISFYGRQITVIIFMYVVYKYIGKRVVKNDLIRRLLRLTFAQIVVFSPIVIYQSLLAPKYLLPITILISITALYYLSVYARFKYIIYTLILLSTFVAYFDTGQNKSWEATPAHWPYYGLRNRMIKYIDKSNIPYAQVGSFFPNLKSQMLTDVGYSDSSFVEFNLAKNNYVFYSNVYNDGVKHLSQLNNKRTWEIEKRFDSMGVYIILFKRK